MRYRYFIIGLLLAVMAVGCGHRDAEVDALLRSKVDALNKAAFKARYDDAHRSERYARRALAYVNDSLPGYADGRLRAWNNIATSYYNRAVHDSVYVYVDSVLMFNGSTANSGVEQALAKLLKARTLQRHCDIAGSYQLLYDIEQSGLLDSKEDGLLYNLARSEFYITTTTLNYHYRNKSQYEQAELLTEMEARRAELRCDYSEDMSFNYALAYGYHSLCVDTAMQSHYLGKALYYCMENFRILNDSLRYNTYHLGNTYQLIGFMLWNSNLQLASWLQNDSELDDICNYVLDAFGFDAYAGIPDTAPVYHLLAFPFLSEATSLFFLHDDPYQRLGAVVATGRYCMAHGDTLTARTYFNEALIDTTMLGVAPKFEAMLYEGLLTSGLAKDNEEVTTWTRKELELLNRWNNWIIDANAKIAAAPQEEWQKMADKLNADNAEMIEKVNKIFSSSKGQKVLRGINYIKRMKQEAFVLDSLGVDQIIKDVWLSQLVNSLIEETHTAVSPMVIDTLKSLIHNTLGINNIASHQRCAESDIVEISDCCSMSQFLLIEVRHFEHCAKRHIGVLISVDVRLNRTQVFVRLNKRRIGLCTEIVCHVIVGTGNNKCACCQHQETIPKL